MIPFLLTRRKAAAVIDRISRHAAIVAGIIAISACAATAHIAGAVAHVVASSATHIPACARASSGIYTAIIAAIAHGAALDASTGIIRCRIAHR